MKLIKIESCQDWGQDIYLLILSAKHWTLFQACISWCVYSSWPYVQFSFGVNSLFVFLIGFYKFSFTFSLFEHT